MRQIIFTQEIVEELRNFAFGTPEGPADPTLELRQSLRGFFETNEPFSFTIIFLAINTIAIQKFQRK